MGCCSSKRKNKQNSKSMPKSNGRWQFHSGLYIKPDHQNLPSLEDKTMHTIAGDFEFFNDLEGCPGQLNNIEEKEIKRVLSTHPIFYCTNDIKLKQITKKFVSLSYEAKTCILNVKDKSKFFIIAEGEVEFILENSQKAVLSSGMHFGETSLFSYKSEAQFNALTNVKCWVLSIDKGCKEIIEESSKHFDEYAKLIEKNLFLNQIYTESAGVILSFSKIICSNSNSIEFERHSRDNIYAVKKGKIILSHDECNNQVLDTFEVFSDFDLNEFHRGQMSIEIRGKTEVMSLDLSKFNSLDENLLRHLKYGNSVKISLEKDHKLSKLRKEEKEKIINNTSIHLIEPLKTFEAWKCKQKCQIIFPIKGNLSILGHKIKENEIIITRKLSNTNPSSESSLITAKCNSVIAVITESTIKELLGGKLKIILKKNRLLSLLKRVSIFRGFPDEILTSLLANIRVVEFAYNQKIFDIHDENENLYIIQNGQVIIETNRNHTKTCLQYDYFCQGEINEQSTPKISAISLGCKCILISKKFLKLNNSNILDKNFIEYDKEENLISLNDLNLIKLIGKGTYGNVFLSYCCKTSKFYALKSVHKRKVEEFDVFDNLIQEKKILGFVDHPFIVKSIKSFNEGQRILFLMEMIKGIDMFDHFHNSLPWDEDKIRFYSACLVLALEYLHKRKVIYRDLKPENIKIDEQGFPVLMDFGLSKIVKGRTYSHAGSSHYMSPQVILGKGYGFEADYWSLGVMIYEFFYGEVPWGSKDSNPLEISKKIIEGKLNFPSKAQNPGFIKLISQLLGKTSNLRENIKDIKKHIWFAGVDFKELIERKAVVPFKPQVEDYSKFVNKKSVKRQDHNNFFMKHEEKFCRSSTKLYEEIWDRNF